MTDNELRGPIRVTNLSMFNTTVSRLIETAEKQGGLVSVRNLFYVPELRVDTSNWPQSQWPDFKDIVDVDRMEVALVLAFFQVVPVEVLKTTDWWLLEHQCAGVCCAYESMVGIRLDPRPEIRAAFVEIARRYWGTSLGRQPVHLSDLEAYRGSLLELGLDCNTSYPRLNEGVYPVDSSGAALERVAVDPPEIATAVADRPFVATICFLAPNSD